MIEVCKASKRFDGCPFVNLANAVPISDLPQDFAFSDARFAAAKLAVLVETFFVKKVLPQAPFQKTLLHF